MIQILALVGLALLIVCGMILLIKAFRDSAAWGLAVMFVPLGSLLFWLRHREKNRPVFAASILGLLLLMPYAIHTAENEGKEDAPPEIPAAVHARRHQKAWRDTNTEIIRRTNEHLQQWRTSIAARQAALRLRGTPAEKRSLVEEVAAYNALLARNNALQNSLPPALASRHP